MELPEAAVHVITQFNLFHPSRDAPHKLKIVDWVVKFDSMWGVRWGVSRRGIILSDLKRFPCEGASPHKKAVWRAYISFCPSAVPKAVKRVKICGRKYVLALARVWGKYRRLSGMREFSSQKYTSLSNISTYRGIIKNWAPMSSRA